MMTGEQIIGELGNFDGEISVDEMSAYIASLERRLAASTGYAKKSLDLQLTIARNALTNLRSQFAGAKCGPLPKSAEDKASAPAKPAVRKRAPAPKVVEERSED